jgi:hypothetical protein
MKYKMQTYLNNLEGYELFAKQYLGDPYWNNEYKRVRTEKKNVLAFLATIGVTVHMNTMTKMWEVDGCDVEFAF